MTAPVPAGPTDAQAELRETIADAIAESDSCTRAAWPGIYEDRADAVLALPAVRDALAAQEKVRRVRHLLDDCEPDEGYYLRRALAGES